jgi:acetylornithine/succinyldiaminopimelate/putrescine aminotransferase
MQDRYLLDLYPNRGLTFVRGQGVYLETAAGERYLDMMTNYGVNILGYAHPAVTRALAAQAERLPTLHGSFGNDQRDRASRALVERLPITPGYLYWANSGAEAVEAALKFAAMATGKRAFVACAGSYHGKTLGALSATHAPKYRAPFEPLLWHFTHVPFGDLAAVRVAVGDDTAAVILEPLQGESGIVTPPEGYLRRMAELCATRGVLLIVDEIQSGCGRTGTFTASEHEGVRPDIICLGKGLAGGVPVGVTAVCERVAASVTRGSHTSTFGGNPLAAAGVSAVLASLDDAMLARVANLGEFFRAQLRAIRHDLVTDVRGRGLMIGLALKSRRDDVLKRLQRERILAIPAGNDVVRFLPAYVIEREELARVADACERVLTGL